MKNYFRATHIVASHPALGQERESFSSGCPHCGIASTRIGAGRKPQEASLHCRGCKRFIRWIAAGELARKGGEA